MLCLQSKFKQVLAVLGTVCSTWVAVNAATSGRSYLTPAGNPEVPSVLLANRMVARKLCTNLASNTYVCIYMLFLLCKLTSLFVSV